MRRAVTSGTAIVGSSERLDVFAAILRGECVPWPALHSSPSEFLRSCHEQGLTGLVYARMLTRPAAFDWPRDVREGLAR